MGQAALFQTQAPNYVYVVSSDYYNGKTVDYSRGSLEVLAPDATTGVPGLVATIPVGVDPAQVALSPDGLTAWVTNTGDGTISIIDLASLQVMNLDPRGIYGNGSYALRLPTGASPNYLTIAPSGDNGAYTVFVDDRHDGELYIIQSGVIQDAIKGFGPRGAAGDVQSFAYDASIAGAEGIAVAYSHGAVPGEYAYIASAGTGDQAGADNTLTAGAIYILQVGDLSGVTFSQSPSGFSTVRPMEIPTDPKPFGVTSYDQNGHWYVGVTIRGNQPTGYTLIDCNTQSAVPCPTELAQYPPTVPAVVATLKPQAVGAGLFDTYNAQAIVYATYGGQSWGFVLFHNTYQQGFLSHDPTYGAGGNIGILANPFGANGGKPYFVGATAEIPSVNGSFPNSLAISPDGQFLYVTVTGLNQVYVYSIAKIMATYNVLAQLDPAAVGGPSASQPKPQPLDNWAAQIVANPDAAAFLNSIGQSGARSWPSRIPIRMSWPRSSRALRPRWSRSTADCRKTIRSWSQPSPRARVPTRWESRRHPLPPGLVADSADYSNGPTGQGHYHVDVQRGQHSLRKAGQRAIRFL